MIPKLKFKRKYIFLLILFFIMLIPVVILVVLYQFGTHYFPDTNVNANNIRFKNPQIKKDIQNMIQKTKVISIEEIISLSLKITNKRLYYDTSTLLGRKNTDLIKSHSQDDVDWLYKNGNANCIGYAYLFAATFNEIKRVTPDIASCSIRIIYESPVHILFGYIKGKHTWNEIVYMENGKEMKMHVDATAADYFLSWNVKNFIKS